MKSRGMMSIRKRMCWGIFGVLLVSLPVLSHAQDINKDKLSAYLDTLAAHDKVMGSVAIAKGGELIFQKATGIRQEEPKKMSSDTQTLYRIGSVSKMYTATMIMQLVEEGQLKLDTKLATFYPDLPNASQITMEQMLRHQSGLFNFTSDPKYMTWMKEPRTKDQMLDMIAEYDAEFEPGSQTKYSNTNYVLLGYIVEQLTGKTYTQALQERILESLELKHTYFMESGEAQHMARSFSYHEGKWSTQPSTDMSIPGGAGAIISRPSDMVVFIRGLFQGKLVNASSLERMRSMESGLGIGMMTFPFGDKKAFGHNGGIDGFQSNLAYFPKEDVAMAFTGNGMNYNMNNVLIGLLSITFDQPFEIPDFSEKSVSLNADQLKQYTGTYETEQLPIDLKVFVDGSNLMAQGTGQSPFPLQANSETKFRFDPAGIVIEFSSLKDGRYQQLNLKQGGGQFTLTRKSD
jgi:D-alanyl-D-alanine carboxypeptidase